MRTKASKVPAVPDTRKWHERRVAATVHMDLSLSSASRIDHIEGDTQYRDNCHRLRARLHSVAGSPRQRLAVLRSDGTHIASLSPAKLPDGSNSSTVGAMHSCTVRSCMLQPPFDESLDKKQLPLIRKTDKHVIKILPRVPPSLILFGANAACCRNARGSGFDGARAKESPNQVAIEEGVVGSLPDGCHASVQHTCQGTFSPCNAPRRTELPGTTPPNSRCSWLRKNRQSKHPTMLVKVQPKLELEEDVCELPQKILSPKRSSAGTPPQEGIEEGVTAAFDTSAQSSDEIVDLFDASLRNKYDWLRSNRQFNKSHELTCTTEGSQQSTEVGQDEESPTARIRKPMGVGLRMKLNLEADHDEMVALLFKSVRLPESSPSLIPQRVCNVEQLAQWPCIKSVVPDPLQQLSSHDIAALMLSGAGNLDTVFILLSALQRGVSLALGGRTLPFQAKVALFMAAKSRLCERKQRNEAQQRRSPLRRRRLYKLKPQDKPVNTNETRLKQTTIDFDGNHEDVTCAATARDSCAPPSVYFNVTDRCRDLMARPDIVQSPALPTQNIADANDEEAKIDNRFTDSNVPPSQHCESTIVPNASPETTSETRAYSVSDESPYMHTAEASPGVAPAITLDGEEDVVAPPCIQVGALLSPAPSAAPRSRQLNAEKQSNETTSTTPTVSTVTVPTNGLQTSDVSELSKQSEQQIETSNASVEVTSTVSAGTMPATCLIRSKESTPSKQQVHRTEKSSASVEVTSPVSMETTHKTRVERNGGPAPSRQLAERVRSPNTSVKQQHRNPKSPKTTLGPLHLLPTRTPTATEVALTPHRGVLEKQQVSGMEATEASEAKVADIGHEPHVCSWNPTILSGGSSTDGDDDSYWDDEMYGSAWKAIFDNDTEQLILDDAIEQKQQIEEAHDISEICRKTRGELRASIATCDASLERSSPDAAVMALLNAARQESGSSGKWVIEVKPPLVRWTDRKLEDYSPQVVNKGFGHISQKKKRHLTLVETVFSVAEKLFAQCHWHECVKATTTVVCNHSRDTAACTVAALELRAAVWMRLENWDQVVTDTTAVLRYKLADASTTIRAHARRAHARYKLSSLLEVNDEDAAIHLKHCAIVDAKVSHKAQLHDNDSTEESNAPSDAQERAKVVWDAAEDGPRLMRAKVLRGVGLLRAARAELEAENAAKRDNWRVMWSLGETLAAEAGIEWHDISAATTTGGVKTHKLRKLIADANLRQVDKTHMARAATLMARAVETAQRAGELDLVPFQLVMTFGDVQIARFRATRCASMFDVPNDRRMAAKLANNHYAGEPPLQPSKAHHESTISFRRDLIESLKSIADRFEQAIEHKKHRALLSSGKISTNDEVESHSSTGATVHEGKGISISFAIASEVSASSSVGESSNKSAQDLSHSRRNAKLLRAGMALQLARIYFEAKEIFEARLAVKSALRLFAAFQGLPGAVELEAEDMSLKKYLWLHKMNPDTDSRLSHDGDDTTCTTVDIEANCGLKIISHNTFMQLEAVSRLILGMSFAYEVEDLARRKRRHTNDTTKTTYPNWGELRTPPVVGDTDGELGLENERRRCMLAFAERQLDLANQLAPHDGDILCARAAVRRARQHAIAAMSDLDTAVRLEPSVHDAHVARASLFLYELCDFDAAERAALDAKIVSPTYDLRPRLLLAACAAKRGQATKCQRHLSHACHMFPADAAVHRLRAMAATFPAGNPSERSKLRADEDDDDHDKDKRRAATIVAQAADCFLFCVKQYGGSEWGISSTQLHEYSGQLAMSKDSHTAAIKAFETALLEHAGSEEDNMPCSLGEYRSRRRAALGLAESSVYCGKYDRASELIEELLDTTPQHHREEIIELARLEHLRARVFAGNGEIATAYAAFDRALEMYTRFVVHQGLAINVSHFAADNLNDNPKSQVGDVLEKAAAYNVLNNFETFRNHQHSTKATSKGERLLSTAQCGRANVLYHRAIFRACVTLRFGVVKANEDLGDGSVRFVPTIEGSVSRFRTETTPTQLSGTPASSNLNNQKLAKHKGMQRAVDRSEKLLVCDKRPPTEESEEDCEMRQMTAKWIADARRCQNQARGVRGMYSSRTTYRKTKLHAPRGRRKKQIRRSDEKPEVEAPTSKIGEVVAGQRRPARPSDLPRYSLPVLAALGLEDLVSALRQNPWHHEARLLRAELHAMGGNFEAAAIDCQTVLDTCSVNEYRPTCKALVCRSVLRIQEDVAKGDDVQLETSNDLTKAMELLSTNGRSERNRDDDDDDLLLTCAAYNRGIARAAASDLRQAHVDFSLVIDLLTAKLKVGNLSKRRAWRYANFANAPRCRRNALYQLTAAFANRAVVSYWLGETGAHCLEDIEKAASLERELALAFTREDDPKSVYDANLARTCTLPNASVGMVDVAIAARQVQLETKRDRWSVWRRTPRDASPRLPTATIEECDLIAQRTRQKRVVCIVMQRAVLLRRMGRPLEAAGACAAALSSHWRGHAPPANDLVLFLNHVAVTLRDVAKAFVAKNATQTSRFLGTYSVRNWPKLVRSVARGEQCIDRTTAIRLAKQALVRAVYARPDCARSRFNLAMLLYGECQDDAATRQLEAAKLVDRYHVPSRLFAAARACDEGRYEKAKHDLYDALSATNYSEVSARYPRELTADRVASCAAGAKAIVCINLAVLFQICGEHTAADRSYAKVEHLDHLLAHSHPGLRATAAWARTCNALVKCNDMSDAAAETHACRALHLAPGTPICLQAIIAATAAITALFAYRFDDAENLLKVASDKFDSMRAEDLPDWLPAQTVAAVVWANRASALMATGHSNNTNETISFLNKSLAHLPHYTNLHRQLAACLQLANKFLLAMKTFNCALAVETETTQGAKVFSNPSDIDYAPSQHRADDDPNIPLSLL